MTTPYIYELNAPLLDKPMETTFNNTFGHIVMTLLGFLLGVLLQFSGLAVFWMLQRKVTDDLAFEIFSIWSFVVTLIAMTLIVFIGSMISGKETPWIQTIEVVGVVAAMFGATSGIVFSSIALDVEMNYLFLAAVLVCHSGVCVGFVKWSETRAKDEEDKEEKLNRKTSLLIV